MDMTDTSGTVSLQEAKRILQVSENTIRRWRQKGYITGIKKPSGRYLYNLEELERIYHDNQ